MSINVLHLFCADEQASKQVPVGAAEHVPGQGDEIELLPAMEEEMGKLSPIKSK